MGWLDVDCLKPCAAKTDHVLWNVDKDGNANKKVFCCSLHLAHSLLKKTSTGQGGSSSRYPKKRKTAESRRKEMRRKKRVITKVSKLICCACVLGLHISLQ